MTTSATTAICTQGFEKQSQRRQNKSCDQCRYGKRRCDVQTFYSQGTFSSTTCSNCIKWKKRCTTQWAQSRHVESSRPSKRRCSNSAPYMNIASATSFNLDFGISESWADIWSHPSDNPPLSLPSEVENNEHIDEYWHSGNGDSGLSFESPDSSLLFQASSQPDRGIYGAFPAQPGGISWTPTVGELATNWIRAPGSSVTANKSQTDRENDPLMEEIDDAQVITVSDGLPYLMNTLADTRAKGWLRSGLMKIYHDSMEGALGCWLVSRNCPYPVVDLDTDDAWSPSWSNRVTKSVCDLDHFWYEAGFLSDSHQKQGSRVLNLVIMAFAAQWAQSGPRTTAQFPSTGQSCQSVDNDPFGGNLQERLWDEASQALSTANNNPSFKAILAGVIFSLTQRPLGAGATETRNTRNSSTLDDLHTILGQDDASVYLDVALRKLHTQQRRFHDTPKHVLPAQHQKTFRLLLWLAVMFDTLSATMNKRSFVVSDQDSSIDSNQGSLVEATPIPTSPLDLDGLTTWSEDRTAALPGEPTIWGNYFMRDTLNHKRMTVRLPCTYSEAATCLADAAPVKVLMFRRVGHLQDLLYQHASRSTFDGAISAAFDVCRHWNATYGLFISDCIDQHELLPARIQSWYILLAGHWHLAVLLLADLLDKIDFINGGTSDTLRQTSVDFVAQLGRVSSLADLTGDENEYNTSASPSSFSQSPHFHHAVNQAALLTEPWTVVLVRVFGKAAELLIRQIQDQCQRTKHKNHVPPISCIETDGFAASVGAAHSNFSHSNGDSQHKLRERQKLKWCLEALWLLGRKSDVAVRVVSLLLKLEAAAISIPCPA